MSTVDQSLQKQLGPPMLKNILLVIALLVAGLILLAVGLFAVQSATDLSPLQAINDFLGLTSLHIWWYITRRPA